jgi:hypothetical protein
MRLVKQNQGIQVDEATWTKFIQHYWLTLAYWEIMKCYRTTHLGGAFFALSSLATQNELMMCIVRIVDLCNQMEREYPDLGDGVKNALVEINTVYARGHKEDRACTKFENCGIKVFRDKVLAHPVTQVKALFGRNELQISVEWGTVEATLNAVKKFADQVEEHYCRSGHSDFTTDKEAVAGVGPAFLRVALDIRDSKRYDELKLEIAKKGGKASVIYDRIKDEIVVEDARIAN